MPRLREAIRLIGEVLAAEEAGGPTTTLPHPLERLVDMLAERAAVKVAACQERDRKRLFSITEAAEYLALSHAQVYRLVASGRLNCVREGRRRLLDRDQLDRWIANRTQ